MFKYIKNIYKSFKKKYQNIDDTQDIESISATSIVNISFTEFNKIGDFIKKHRSELSDDFFITIETHPGSIGTTVIAKISDWIGTKTLAEENVTDHHNW